MNDQKRLAELAAADQLKAIGHEITWSGLRGDPVEHQPVPRSNNR